MGFQPQAGRTNQSHKLNWAISRFWSLGSSADRPSVWGTRRLPEILKVASPALPPPSCVALGSASSAVSTAMMMIHICVRGPWDHLQVLWFTRRTYRTQHMVIFMDLMYYSERTQNTIFKEKRWMVWSLEGPGAGFQNFLPGQSHRMHLIPTQWVVIWGRSHRHQGRPVETQHPGCLLGHRPRFQTS